MVTAAGLAGGCAQPASSDGAPAVGRAELPLIGGQPDDADPASVALAYNGQILCSGTLISPRVVVTAAHCIDNNYSFTVFFGADFASGGNRVSAIRRQVAPGWTGSLADYHDIGLLLLSQPVDPTWPVPLRRSPMGDGDLGGTVRRVGFGVDDASLDMPDGKKRTADAEIHFVSTQDWYLAGSEDSTPCHGDSGGSALWTDPDSGEEQLIGVHSFGFSGCTGQDTGDTRVDLYADDFIQPWVEENDRSCGADELCARIGCDSDPDCQPCGPDGTCATGCATPDLDCRTQDLGEICRADSQCATDLCVYWQDDPDTHFCSKKCEGPGDCPSGMSCRSVSPFGKVCYYDDDPPGVAGSSCDGAAECGSYVCQDGTCVSPCDLALGEGCPGGFECLSRDDGATYYCRARDDGGCSVVAPAGSRDARGPGGLVALMAALVVLAGAMHRRRRTRTRSRRA